MKSELCNQNIGRKCISLKCLGLNEVAWTFDGAMDLLDQCQNNNRIVLGGDVYKIIDGRIKDTGDNWYHNEGTDDVVNSVKKAREYIHRYCKRNKGDFAFCIVIKKTR